MLRSRAIRRAFVAAVSFAAFVAATWPVHVGAVEPALEELQFREQLAAGEFAPAMNSALALERGQAHDGRLASLAATQARTGASQSGLLTASQIDDGSVRGATYRQIARSRPHQRCAMGGTQADFDALIDLITATIAPTSWDTVGGPGSVQPFEGGVHCDAEGTLRPALGVDRSGALAAMRRRARWLGETPAAAAKTSQLRKVSLSRLEKHLGAATD